MIKDVIIQSVEAWAIPGLMNWNNLEPLALETRIAQSPIYLVLISNGSEAIPGCQTPD
jgi:hypothetical protein